MKAIIITGGSKGLGKALTTLYNRNGYVVYSLSRSLDETIENINQVSIDLCRVAEAERVIETILDNILSENPTSITLINNAGTLGKMDILQEIPSNNIESTISLNYTTPMVLCSTFSRKLERYNGIKRIRNISSGAANSAYHGWSVYCSTKAAMDSFSKVMAIEQNDSLSPIHILSIYPGVIDTEMQAEIRQTTEKEFSNVGRFRDMKQNNDLSAPDEIAKIIYNIDHLNSIKNGELVDVRDF